MDDRRVGRAIREIRVHLRLRQRDLAIAAGLSQRLISDVELGRLEHVSLGSLRKVAQVLDVQVSIDAWWRSGRVDHLLDRTHAALVEATMRALVDAGWEVRAEYTFREYSDKGSVDILAWHAATSTLAIIEVKTRIDDVQDAAASFMRKVRVVPKVVARDEAWDARSVVRVLVMADTHQNRDLVARHRTTFASIWPERTAAVARHLLHPERSSIEGGIRFVKLGTLGATAWTSSRVRRPGAARDEVA